MGSQREVFSSSIHPRPPLTTTISVCPVVPRQHPLLLLLLDPPVTRVCRSMPKKYVVLPRRLPYMNRGWWGISAPGNSFSARLGSGSHEGTVVRMEGAVLSKVKHSVSPVPELRTRCPPTPSPWVNTKKEIRRYVSLLTTRAIPEQDLRVRTRRE
ncbi:hypothetical protein VTI28DRAFT_1876 [Corynascus sepedonium]